MNAIFLMIYSQTYFNYSWAHRTIKRYWSIMGQALIEVKFENILFTEITFILDS